MKRICWLFLLPGLCLVRSVGAQERSDPPANRSGRIIAVELQGDTAVYRSVEKPRGAGGASFRRSRRSARELPSHALSLEGGIYPLCGNWLVVPGSGCHDDRIDRFPGEFPGERRYYMGPQRTSGAWSVVYGYRIRRWLDAGLSVTYAGVYRDLLRTADGGTATRGREHYLSLMPGLRFSWFNSRYVRLYSGLQMGCQWSSERYFWTDRADGACYVAVQATPLGVSVGRRLFGYAEWGVGVRGLFVCGVGFRFGREK